MSTEGPPQALLAGDLTAGLCALNPHWSLIGIHFLRLPCFFWH